MNKIFMVRWNEVALCIIGAIVVVFLCDLYINPLLINYGGDSAVFQEMGLVMVNGKIPYVDLFDHKGFYLYCIQALGFIIAPNKIGIFILAILNFSICLYLWMQIAKCISSSKIVLCLSVIAVILSYGVVSDRGNTSEVWSLPFITFPVYLYVRYICESKEIGFVDCLLIGACMGICSHIRLNNIIPIACICLFFLVAYIRKKKYSEIVKSAAYVIMSMVFTFSCLCLLYCLLYGYENLDQLFFANFTFNFAYLGKAGGNGFVSFPFVIGVFLLVCAFCLNRGHKALYYSSLIGCVLTFLSFSSAYFNHYYIVCLPYALILYVLIIDSVAIKKLLSIIKEHKGWVLAISLFPIISCFTLLAPKVEAALNRGQVYEDALKDSRDFLKRLPKHQLKNIWNMNAKAQGLDVLLVINQIQVNRLIQYNHVKMCPSLKGEKDMVSYSPDLILLYENTKWSDFSSKDSAFVCSNYQTIHKVKLKTSSSDNILILRRNDLCK